MPAAGGYPYQSASFVPEDNALAVRRLHKQQAPPLSPVIGGVVVVSPPIPDLLFVDTKLMVVTPLIPD
ncbi:hypothetical protein JN662_004581 [Salmonella enterica]|uniref:hypothetical protein n=1 Tax=Salmonella enterica TaxID=28901 RepID=UPI00138AAC8A|nr:hypothetical protein [Salmonella enterica]EDN5775865.1 hypothetical protein [Salmonella enterica subsp. enterica serovar Newport]EEA0225376.1 hypothetical protein [Salmonella enterica subsp. enterica serovar Newport]EEB8128909.1 hypothetical protein [Salmonella enterica subsp. enterica serovar Newport]EEG7922890.1 hypothetical protein [Salmonella enterica subsp. enterica serovar Newport]EEH3938023.1 hypothetical protein [Salmonella enterica subsp. enterica serovar Newport]